jgi:2-polyprenyl-3-methyl-5-hydroxy-6-metoxy-1,4-benzoquinol methylase
LSVAWPERIDPLTEIRGVVSHHLKKYEFARSVGRGVVVDVACGVGYGSAHLAAVGLRVIGIEIDADAVGIARDRYGDDRTSFVRADAEALPLRHGAADTVVCFEGIEHFVHPENHVREAARILDPQGVYLLSTPRPGARGDHGGHADNPHHFHEFSREEMIDLLGRWFGEVRVLGQRRIQTTSHRAVQVLDVLGLRRLRWVRPVARRLSRALKTAPVEEATLASFAIDGHLDEALEFVVVCRQPREP